jgi:SAM-dependent methyltransferase
VRKLARVRGITLKKHTERIELKALDGQRGHWERVFLQNPDMLGTDASRAGRYAAKLFKKEGVKDVLELGGGQGRDSVYLARKGFSITTLEYTESGVEAISVKAEALGLTRGLTVVRHDVRLPLPFEDGSFDACYSHMLLCMALTSEQLEGLMEEVRRALRPGGLVVYTARNTKDAHYRAGTHHGEDMYESGGFIVHFFSREKVDELAKGFEAMEVEEFEEGALPRRLYRVTMRKR